MAKITKWFGKEVDSAVAKKVTGAIKEGCVAVERDAKKNCPVITTRLRGSITHEVEGPVGRVGSNVEYARRVELGFVGTDSLGRKYNQKPNPYLRKALETNRKKIEDSFKNLIK